MTMSASDGASGDSPIFTLFVEQSLALIEETLDQFLRTCDPTQNLLYEAARYSVLSKGKRMRPLFCMATAAIYDVPPIDSFEAAASLELIHTYSLIHDDLPAMDDDDFRRGMPTTHRVYGEAEAILTGDFLLNASFGWLANLHCRAEQRLDLIKALAHAGGARGLIGGQMLDIRGVLEPPSLSQLETIHRRKSGKLFGAALEFGAILGNASDGERAKLAEIGELFGLAFQIADDVLDLVDSEEKHGRALSSDVAKGKKTHALLLGIEGARSLAQSTFESCFQQLHALNRETALLEMLLRWSAKRMVRP